MPALQRAKFTIMRQSESFSEQSNKENSPVRTERPEGRTAVIAIGGNALLPKGESGTAQQQIGNIRICCRFIADLAEEGYQIILTHGNGPQVGNVVLQNDIAKEVVPENPLDICSAQTQGALGYSIARVLRNELHLRGLSTPVAVLLSQVIVDEDDPAFHRPTKFIGPYFTEQEALAISRRRGFLMRADSGRGYRRVVPSPYPQKLVELDAMRQLHDAGYILITAGGGGIPVIQKNDCLIGTEAVIDKDYTSSLVAQELDADFLLILTGVSKAAIHFNTPQMRALDVMTVSECLRYEEEGEFPAGSMGPKIAAAREFVQQTGHTAIITSLESMEAALKGNDGTRIIPG